MQRTAQTFLPARGHPACKATGAEAARRAETWDLQMEDLLDIALSALQWSNDGSLPRAERAMAHRLFTLALALSEQEHPPAHDCSMLKAMICHLCRATEKTLCATCPFGYCE